MSGCNHQPRCGTASVHHARRNRDLNLARESSRLTADSLAHGRARLEATRSSARVPNCKADPTLLRATAGRAPWELTHEEFEAVSEPWFELSPYEFGACRMYGLSISQMRFGVRLRLVILGGPVEGYVADVEASDAANLDDARRAFVAEALARGVRVPPHVLADYPDLAPSD